MFFFKFKFKLYRVLFRVSDFTISPVFLADDMTIRLQNIKCEIEDNPCLSLKERTFHKHL